MMTATQARTELASEVDSLVAMLDPASFDTSVPSCPGWTVRDVVVHLGDIHRWVVQAMTTGNTADPPRVAPADAAALLRWYRSTADRLLELFAVTEPDAPVWTFGPPPGRAEFWFRRQVHEIGLHRWDVGAATGTDVDFKPERAEDGIDEVVTMFFPRQVRLGRTEPLPASLALEPEGSSQRWVLAGNGTSPPVQADATVSGSAAALLLLLWGRIGVGDQRLRLTGSPAAAATVLGMRIVP